MSSYATKSDLKNAADVNASKFPKKTDFASLKIKVDKLDVYKLEKVTSGLKNLKSKVDKIGVDKLNTVPADLKK